MKRVAIIGGGISGLSASFYLERLRREGVALDYVLYEAAGRFGGSMFSEHVDDCVVEAGPDSFLSEKPWAQVLARHIGLEDQLIGSNDAQRKTYILVNGRLVVIPDGLMFMVPTKLLPTVFTPLFSWGTKLRMAAEWLHPPRASKGDETVASLVKRHYGPEMVDRLADPLLSGVYGGEAANLSVRAVLPRFADMEAKHGSLGRAMLAARKKLPSAIRSAKPLPLFTSMKDGMQQMVDGILAQANGAALRTSSPVRELKLRDRAWQVTANGATESYDAIVIAVPAPAASLLLRPAQPELAAELGQIAYSSSVTVTLGYGKDVLDALPPGFGFLVPRTEGRRMLACTFVHTKFPHRAPPDRALLRVFLGGSRDEEILSVPDSQIVELVRGELRQILGVTADPRFSRVYKWKGAMAQYSVGHLDRLERIERLRQSLPGLTLAGNAYRGIGVPDCILSGQKAAEEIAGPSPRVTEVIPATANPVAPQQVR